MTIDQKAQLETAIEALKNATGALNDRVKFAEFCVDKSVGVPMFTIDGIRDWADSVKTWADFINDILIAAQ